MAEGKLISRSGNVTLSDCVFVTQDCASTETSLGRRLARRMGYDFASWELKRLALPDVKPGGFGSCALVANSDNLLKSQRGEDIDRHDTVFRHNTPVKGFEKYVGKRSTVVWVKGGYRTGASGVKVGDGNADFAYALLHNIEDEKHIPRDFRYHKKHIFLRGNAAPFARARRELYSLAGGGGRRNHPSGGFSRPLNLLASGLCKRIDLYGFGGFSSGKYFAKSRKVMAAHLMGFEHWVYRYLQSKGKLCIYGD